MQKRNLKDATPAEKRSAIEELLKENPKMSGGKIAELTGLPPTTIQTSLQEIASKAKPESRFTTEKELEDWIRKHSLEVFGEEIRWIDALKHLPGESGHDIVTGLVGEDAKSNTVYLDETGFTPQTLRLHGYAPRGQRVVDMRSSHQYKSRSLIAARLNGDFITSSVFTGSCNAERFNEWLQTVLCPHLDETHCVILDNARWHKTQRTHELIAATGACLLYLPPYSPDLNPIEHDFANIKRRWQYNHHQTLEDIIQMYK